MRTTATVLAALSGVNAIISGLSVPSTLGAGQTAEFELVGHNYIQAVADVAVSFGVKAEGAYGPESLGSLLGVSALIGPAESNIIGNIPFNISIPSDTPQGSSTITAAVFSLYGTVASPAIQYFNVTVQVGTETSSDYVRSS